MRTAIAVRRGEDLRSYMAARVIRHGECLEYTGTRDKNGYGRVEIVHSASMRVVELAHRVAFLLQNGQIGEGQVIRHTCDNPPCVNPDHLLSGTPSDNMHDMMSRRRRTYPRGERAQNAKLTAGDVLAMREMAKEGISQREISRRFGVSHTVGRKAITAETWRHI